MLGTHAIWMHSMVCHLGTLITPLAPQHHVRCRSHRRRFKPELRIIGILVGFDVWQRNVRKRVFLLQGGGAHLKLGRHGLLLCACVFLSEKDRETERTREGGGEGWTWSARQMECTRRRWQSCASAMHMLLHTPVIEFWTYAPDAHHQHIILITQAHLRVERLCLRLHRHVGARLGLRRRGPSVNHRGMRKVRRED